MSEPPTFLVRITVDLSEVPLEVRQRLIDEERVVAKALRDRGVIERMWRLGVGGTVSVWHASGEADLWSELRRLPLFEWFDVHVEELHRHYLEDE